MNDKDALTLYICNNGDRSVGIWPMEMSINIDKHLVEEKEDRENFRKDCIDLFNNWSDGSKIRYSFFSDECSECGNLLTESPSPICPNLNCISNIDQTIYPED